MGSWSGSVVRNAPTAVAALLVAGCASIGSVRDAPLHRGEHQIWFAPLDSLRLVAYDAIVGAGLRIESVDELDDGGWMILATRASGLWSWGQVVRLTIRPWGRKHTRVAVLTRRRIPTSLMADGDYSDAIFDQITFHVGQPVGVPTTSSAGPGVLSIEKPRYRPPTGTWTWRERFNGTSDEAVQAASRGMTAAGFRIRPTDTDHTCFAGFDGVREGTDNAAVTVYLCEAAGPTTAVRSWEIDILSSSHALSKEVGRAIEATFHPTR